MCVVWGLKKLDVIQARALGICLGAVKTTPLCALQVEAGEMPLHIRRQQLTIYYWADLKGHNKNHPVKKENCWERGKEFKNSFGWVGDDRARAFKVYDKEFIQTVVRPLRPTWTWDSIRVDRTLVDIKKREVTTDLCQECYSRLEGKYSGYVQVHTDV